MRSLTATIHYSVLACGSIVVWAAFYPGLITMDGYHQHIEALFRQYTDWHPPLTSALLTVIYMLGGNFSVLLLAQVVAGFTGIYYLTAQITRSQHMAFLSAMFFFLPITPFIFYSVTLWKDSHLAVSLIWLTALLINLRNGAGWHTSPQLYLKVFTAVLLASLMANFRHNAFVVLLPVSASIFLAVREQAKRLAVAATIATIICPIMASALINYSLNVQHSYLSIVMKAQDLSSVLRMHPELSSQFPYTNRQANIPLYKGADCKRSSRVIQVWGPNGGLGPSTIKNDTLDAEYLRALREYPLYIAYAKVTAFWEMMSPRQWRYYYFHSWELPPDCGFRFNSTMSGVRKLITYAIGGVASRPWLFWISGIHLIWLCLSTVIEISALMRRQLFNAFIRAIPLCYYFSYIMSAPATDYRLMFPSTLLTQVLIISIIVPLLKSTKPRIT